MTREQTIEAIRIMQAYVDEKEVEYEHPDGIWNDASVTVVGDTAGHTGINCEDAFHLEAFFSQAKIAWSATAWIFRPAARQ